MRTEFSDDFRSPAVCNVLFEKKVAQTSLSVRISPRRTDCQVGRAAAARREFGNGQVSFNGVESPSCHDGVSYLAAPGKNAQSRGVSTPARDTNWLFEQLRGDEGAAAEPARHREADRANAHRNCRSR